MTNRIPVNPALIRWARERAGFTIDEIARGNLRAIESWETGEQSPTYRQIEALAERVKIPVAAFFFPEAPDVPSIQESFRTIPEAEFASLPAAVISKLRRAKAFQLYLAELYDQRNPSERPIWRTIRVTNGQSLEDLANSVRAQLGIAQEEIEASGSSDATLKLWRDKIQRAGVFTFKDAFKDDRFAGFCIYDNVFPIIYVNNSVPKTRQIFTLLHELGHILRERSGLDPVSSQVSARYQGDERAIEVWCNAFAAEVILPTTVFGRLMQGAEPNEDTAERIAERCAVSREFIFRRFLDRGWISQQTYEQAAQRWRGQIRPRGKGGNPYRTRIAYLGEDYIARAFQKFYQRRLSETELAEFLDTKPRHLPRLEEYLIGEVG